MMMICYNLTTQLKHVYYLLSHISVSTFVVNVKWLKRGRLDGSRETRMWFCYIGKVWREIGNF